LFKKETLLHKIKRNKEVLKGFLLNEQEEKEEINEGFS